MVAGKPLRRWLRTVLHPPVFRTVLHYHRSRQKAGSDENSSLRPVCPDGLPKLRKLTSHQKTSPHAIFSPSEPPNPNSVMVCVKFLSLSQQEERTSENELIQLEIMGAKNMYESQLTVFTLHASMPECQP